MAINDSFDLLANSINIPCFFLMVLPSLLFSLLCVLALNSSDEINKKIRFLLINVFIADIINWLSHSVYYLGLPIAHLFQAEDMMCKFCVSLLVIAVVQRFTANASYALNVYIFIKYGEKQLRWCVVIPFAIVAWILSFGIGLTSYFDVYKIDGFCSVDLISFIFKITSSVLIVLTLMFLIFQIVCSILTGVFIKRNVLEGNTSVKKAVAKVQLYITIAGILSIANTIYSLSLYHLFQAINWF